MTGNTDMITSTMAHKAIFKINLFFFTVSLYPFHLSLMIMIILGLLMKNFYFKNVAVQNTMHLLYGHIEKLCEKHLHTKHYLVIGFFMSMFLYISMLNIIGIFGFYSINSNPFFVGILSVMIFSIFILFGFYNKKHRFITDLSPKNSPNIIKPLIIMLELILIILKPISCSIRLILNVLVGHMCIHILEMLAVKSKGLFVLSLVVSIFVKCIEMFTSLLQGYIFTNMIILLFEHTIDHK